MNSVLRANVTMKYLLNTKFRVVKIIVYFDGFYQICLCSRPLFGFLVPLMKQIWKCGHEHPYSRIKNKQLVYRVSSVIFNSSLEMKTYIVLLSQNE